VHLGVFSVGLHLLALELAAGLFIQFAYLAQMLKG